jgi:hypothetical protein
MDLGWAIALGTWGSWFGHTRRRGKYGPPVQTLSDVQHCKEEKDTNSFISLFIQVPTTPRTTQQSDNLLGSTSISLFIPVMPTFIPLSIFQEPDNLSDINFTLHLFLIMVMATCILPPASFSTTSPPPSSNPSHQYLHPLPHLLTSKSDSLLSPRHPTATHPPLNRPTIKSPSLLSFPYSKITPYPTLASL